MILLTNGDIEPGRGLPPIQGVNWPAHSYSLAASQIRTVIGLLSSSSLVMTFKLYVAGGALRNGLLNTRVNDVDFYLLPYGEVTQGDYTLLKRLLFDAFKSVRGLSPMTLGSQDSRYNLDSINGVIKLGDEADIIICNPNQNIGEVLEEFPVGLSKVAYEVNHTVSPSHPSRGTWVMSPEFLEDFNNQTLTVNRTDSRNSRYIDKIIRQFPDHLVLEK